METENFLFAIPERGTGSEHRDRAHGPDLDGILRDYVRKYMKAANRSPAELATSLDMPVQQLNAWLGGSTGKIDLLSRLVAAAGASSVDEILGGHAAYNSQNSRVTTMKSMLLRRFESMIELEGVRFALDMRMLMHRVPETRAIILCGIKNALDHAESKGVDVQSKRKAIERGYAPLTEQQRAANES